MVVINDGNTSNTYDTNNAGGNKNDNNNNDNNDNDNNDNDDCDLPLVLWSSGPLVLWFSGPLVLWSSGSPQDAAAGPRDVVLRDPAGGPVSAHAGCRGLLYLMYYHATRPSLIW